MYLDCGHSLTAPSHVSLLQWPPSPNHRAPPPPRGRRTPPRKPTPPAKRSAAGQASPSRSGGSGPARGQPPLSRRPARMAAPLTTRGPPRTRGSSYRQVEPGHPDLCPQTSVTSEIHSPQSVPPPKGLQDLRLPPPPQHRQTLPPGDELLLGLPFR